MINFGDIKPWEPYTGGKPSPSVEYPQEIANAGDKGQVDISVLGANLAFSNKLGTGNDAVAYLYGLQKFCIKAKRLTGTSQVNCKFHYENGMTGDDISILSKGESKNEVIKAVDAKYPVKHIAIYAVGVSGDNPITELEYLMVNPENIPYEPYKPAQKLIIPTPDGLPGIPVSSGGNYTDETGQQWVCDEVDLERGKYVQRIVKKTNCILNQQESLSNVTRYDCFLDGNIAKGNFALCNKFIYLCNNSDSEHFYVASSHAQIFADKKYLKHDIEENLVIWYALETPIEHDLPPEIIEAYKKLRTNYPVTTILNDAGAGMKVEYAADTKNYTDNKIAESVKNQMQNLTNLLSLMPMETQAVMIENDVNRILESEVTK